MEAEPNDRETNTTRKTPCGRPGPCRCGQDGEVASAVSTGTKPNGALSALAQQTPAPTLVPRNAITAPEGMPPV
jgi:hypothetical protein